MPDEIITRERLMQSIRDVQMYIEKLEDGIAFWKDRSIEFQKMLNDIRDAVYSNNSDEAKVIIIDNVVQQYERIG